MLLRRLFFSLFPCSITKVDDSISMSSQCHTAPLWYELYVTQDNTITNNNQTFWKMVYVSSFWDILFVIWRFQMSRLVAVRSLVAMCFLCVLPFSNSKDLLARLIWDPRRAVCGPSAGCQLSPWGALEQAAEGGGWGVCVPHFISFLCPTYCVRGVLNHSEKWMKVAKE